MTNEQVERYPVDLPDESAESASEVAKRLMSTVQVGDYRRQYRSLMAVKPDSEASQSRYTHVCVCLYYMCMCMYVCVCVCLCLCGDGMELCGCVWVGVGVGVFVCVMG